MLVINHFCNIQIFQHTKKHDSCSWSFCQISYFPGHQHIWSIINDKILDWLKRFNWTCSSQNNISATIKIFFSESFSHCCFSWLHTYSKNHFNTISHHKLGATKLFPNKQYISWQQTRLTRSQQYIFTSIARINCEKTSTHRECLKKKHIESMRNGRQLRMNSKWKILAA